MSSKDMKSHKTGIAVLILVGVFTAVWLWVYMIL